LINLLMHKFSESK